MNIVTVKINDFEYSLKGAEDAEYISSLAQYVNEKVESIKNNNRKLGTSELSVLAAVNIVDELFKFNVDYKKMKDEYNELVSENNKLRSREESCIKKEENFHNVVEQYEERIKVLQDQIKNITEEKDRAILEINNKTSTLKDEIKSCINQNKEQIKRIEEHYDTMIKNIKEEHNKEFSKLRYKYDKDVETMEKETNKKVESLIANHNNEIDNINSKYEKQISTYKSNLEFMEKTHLYKENSLKEKIQELEVKVIDDNEVAITKLNEEICTLKTKLKNSMEQNKFMEQKGKMYVREIKNLKIENKQIKSNSRSY